MTKVIERNTTIPTKKSQIFSTAADNQPSVEVHVLQGEREFAKDNKTLGVFHLDSIAPAPRGVPQIEVTFDIDANGIVNVSAKDLGTGREQHITITSNTNMSKEDVDKAVKEAEQYASEDKQRREAVEVHNGADQAVYQCEKALTDLGDKVEEADKTELQSKIEALKEANKSDNIEEIKQKQDDLMKKFYEVSKRYIKPRRRRTAALPPAMARRLLRKTAATAITTERSIEPAGDENFGLHLCKEPAGDPADSLPVSGWSGHTWRIINAIITRCSASPRVPQRTR